MDAITISGRESWRIEYLFELCFSPPQSRYVPNPDSQSARVFRRGGGVRPNAPLDPLALPPSVVLPISATLTASAIPLNQGPEPLPGSPTVYRDA
jgi:hypothetical protein